MASLHPQPFNENEDELLKFARLCGQSGVISWFSFASTSVTRRKILASS